MVLENLRILERTYTAKDFGSQVLVKLAYDDSNIVVLGGKKKEKLILKQTK